MLNSLKKKVFFCIALSAIILFNVVIYYLEFAKESRYYNSYIFSMIALLIFTFYTLYFFDNLYHRSRCYMVPMVFIVWPYAILQIFLCFFELTVYIIPYQFFIILNSFILSIVLIGLFSKEIKFIQKRFLRPTKQSDSFIKNIHALVDAITDEIRDDSARVYLYQLLNSIRNSDTISDIALVEIEEEITDKIYYLRNNINNSDDVAEIFDEIQKLLARRNRKCRVLK